MTYRVFTKLTSVDSIKDNNRTDEHMLHFIHSNKPPVSGMAEIIFGFNIVFEENGRSRKLEFKIRPDWLRQRGFHIDSDRVFEQDLVVGIPSYLKDVPHKVYREGTRTYETTRRIIRRLHWNVLQSFFSKEFNLDLFDNLFGIISCSEETSEKIETTHSTSLKLIFTINLANTNMDLLSKMMKNRPDLFSRTIRNFVKAPEHETMLDFINIIDPTDDNPYISKRMRLLYEIEKNHQKLLDGGKTNG